MNTEPTFQNVTTDQLHGWIAENRPMFLIDVLPADHYERRHLPGARHACVYQVDFTDRVSDIGPGADDLIVVYGHSADTVEAATAADKLDRIGYHRIAVFSGGITAWQQAGYRLEGTGGTAAGMAADNGETWLDSDRQLTVDTSQSRIQWTGRNPNNAHFGTLDLSAGRLSVAGGRASGRFDIDMASIKNINLEGDPLQPVLIDHLKSDDFFFVDRFPTARFDINRIEPIQAASASAPNFSVHGQLTLKGVRADLDFAATVNHDEDGRFLAEAHFDIDRTRWNVIYGSGRFFAHLGMHLVFDLISFEVRIAAEPV